MNYYDKIAPGYNELHKKEQLEKINKILKTLTKKEINSKILDVGCGTALYSNFFKNYTGIDPSKGMLEQTKANVIQGNAEKLPFKDNSFDMIISISAIHNFKDYKKAIKEMKRVAKNKIIITLLKKSKKFKEIKEYLKDFKQIDQEVDLILIKHLK
ncbi:class I SAM-dependent methyltransferase [archaeon]|nr:class I SAM-dependent methyltransferase [archaeon]